MFQVDSEEKVLEPAVGNAVGSPSLLLFFDLPVPCHVGIWKLSSIKMIYRADEPFQAAPNDPQETGAGALVPHSRVERFWNWTCLERRNQLD